MPKMIALAGITEAPTACTFRIAGVEVELSGPTAVLTLVQRTLLEGAQPRGPAAFRGRVDLRFEKDVWLISGTAPRANKTLSQLSVLPEICGAVIAAIVAEAAYHAELHVWRASVVERDGDALALVGDDWESCLVLAAHLHVRGWSYVGADYALVHLEQQRVFGLRKLLHANSSMLQSLPLAYRRAVEASPWYVTRRDIAFHAIDPGLARREPWSDGSRLRAIVRVDGDTAEHPALERAQPFELPGAVLSHHLERRGAAIAELTLGGLVHTCDLLEAWFRGARDSDA
ncbi:MAG: hypothetical protein WCE83_00895 [Candidatus Baltobacteraceae bacterium]